MISWCSQVAGSADVDLVYEEKSKKLEGKRDKRADQLDQVIPPTTHSNSRMYLMI